MIARIGCLGLSHHDAPVAVREALCLSPEAQSRLYARAKNLRGFALLSTCNRLEFYVEQEADDARSLQGVIRDLLPPNHGRYLEGAQQYVYEHRSLEAAKHLAGVAAGLDSMVLGESQIQGQVQESLRQSDAHGCAGPLLTAVFQAAVKAGGRVRQETALARNPVSVVSVAVGLVRSLTRPLEEQRFGIVGAGEMGCLTARILRKEQPKRLVIFNRTETRAADLARASGAENYPMTALHAELQEIDVLLCTARGQGVLLDEHHFADRHAPLIVMDLAVPRNVASNVQRLPGVRLYDMDSLRSSVDESLALRRAEVPRAAAIVAKEMEALNARVRALAVEPVIRNLRLKAETIRQQELARALKGMNGLGAEDVARLRQFSQTLVKKLLHEPTTQLRERASRRDAGAESELIRDLFAL